MLILILTAHAEINVLKQSAAQFNHHRWTPDGRPRSRFRSGNERSDLQRPTRNRPPETLLLPPTRQGCGATPCPRRSTPERVFPARQIDFTRFATCLIEDCEARGGIHTVVLGVSDTLCGEQRIDDTDFTPTSNCAHPELPHVQTKRALATTKAGDAPCMPSEVPAVAQHTTARGSEVKRGADEKSKVLRSPSRTTRPGTPSMSRGEGSGRALGPPDGANRVFPRRDNSYFLSPSPLVPHDRTRRWGHGCSHKCT
jgi:hypothetical protein